MFPTRPFCVPGGVLLAVTERAPPSSAAVCVRLPVTSYARIHWQNLANFGVLPLAFEQADDCDRIDAGDRLRLPEEWSLPSPARSGSAPENDPPSP